MESLILLHRLHRRIRAADSAPPITPWLTAWILLYDWKHHVDNIDFIRASEHARAYFWTNGDKQNPPNDCQGVYRDLTDCEPLLTKFSFVSFHEKKIKAIEIIRSCDDQQLQDLFFPTDHYLNIKELPTFLTINDLISVHIWTINTVVRTKYVSTMGRPLVFTKYVVGSWIARSAVERFSLVCIWMVLWGPEE